MLPTMPSVHLSNAVAARAGTLLLCGWLSAIAAGSAGAAAATAGEGTLRAAVDRAAQLDPAVLALEARMQEVDAMRLAAGAAFPGSPTVGASVRRDRPDRDTGRNEVEFEVGFPLWLPGQRTLRQRVAGDEGTEREAAAADARLQVAGRVREALWLVAFARLDQSAARTRLATIDRLVADVERRVSAGVLARSDLLLVRAEATGARSLLVEADARVAQAMQGWRALADEVALPQSWSEAQAAVDGDGRAGGHPSLRAAQRQVELARARLRLATEVTREPPELGLQQRSERDIAGADYRHSVRVALRIPLATEARNQPRIATASTELVRAEAALRQLQLRLEAERARAAVELEAARTQQSIAQDRLRDAEEHLALVRRAFDLGEQPLAAALRALALVDDARTGLDRQRAARERAVARINQAEGVLP